MEDSLKKDIIGGVTSFFATLYIVAVNPAILSQAGMPFDGVVTATVLVTFFGTLLMGLYGKNPIVIAPGMGLNAFFTYSLVLGMDISWQTGLGIVFWSGVIFLLLSLLKVRALLVSSIPDPLKYSLSVGIGLFIAFIGLSKGSLIIDHPVTLVAQSGVSPISLTFIAGLLITAVLTARKVTGALCLGIIATTILCFPIGRLWGDASSINFGMKTLINWKGLVSNPNFDTFMQLDLVGSLKFSLLPAVLSFVITDLFDSLSTFIGVSEAAGLMDKDGKPQNLNRSLLVDSFATIFAGIAGSSPGTAYIESAAGIQAGARTGKAAVVTALCFLPFLFLSPLVSMIPQLATAPILVMVGVFMMSPISKIKWNDLEEAVPCFLSLILIPLTYSITNGIIWGMIFWVVLKLFTGKSSTITKGMWFTTAFLVLGLVYSH